MSWKVKPDDRSQRHWRGQDKTVELPEEIFAAKVNVPLIHQVVVAQQAAARQGTHADQDPRPGPRRRQEAVPAEGHRPRPPGLDPRAPVRRRRRRARPGAALLRAADAEEDEGRGAARRAVRPAQPRPGPGRQRLRRRRRAQDQGRRGRADRRGRRAGPAGPGGRAPRRRAHLEVAAERAARARADRGPAQHLRRAGQRPRGLHRAGPDGVRRQDQGVEGSEGRQTPSEPGTTTRGTSCCGRWSRRRATGCSTRASTPSSSPPTPTRPRSGWPSRPCSGSR